MDIKDVPQDKRDTTHASDIKKLMYAVGKDGQYTGVNYEGWEPENIVLEQTWEDIDENLNKVKAQVTAGELSPIAYFMHKSLMDTTLLASYAGKWKWQVKRHFKPSVFNSLSTGMLEKYARIFNITVDELMNFGKENRS